MKQLIKEDQSKMYLKLLKNIPKTKIQNHPEFLCKIVKDYPFYV